MKKVIYQISDGEAISFFEDGTLIEAFVIMEDKDTDVALLFFPRQAIFLNPETRKWEKEPKEYSDCGSLSLGKKQGKYYVKSKIDYINLSNRQERQLKEASFFLPN